MFKDGVSWTADYNLGDAVEEVQTIQSTMPDVDLFAWWCDYGGGSTAGIAYVGTLCDSWGFGTSLNEYQSSISSAAYVSNVF